MADDLSLPPIAIYITSASSHEITLAEEETITKSVFVHNEKPERLILRDKAYDSHPLDIKLASEYDIDLIAQYRSNRQKANTQDRRILRRYKRR